MPGVQTSHKYMAFKWIWSLLILFCATERTTWLSKVPLFGNLLAILSVIMLKKEVLVGAHASPHADEIYEGTTCDISTLRHR